MTALENLEALEIRLLLEAIYHRFGDDFRGDNAAILRNRLRLFMQSHDISTVSTLQNMVLHEAGYADALLSTLDARSSALFDPPKSFLTLREQLVPWLRSCPAPKIWVADCVAAEDVFSLAILLSEENLHNKTHIYATSRNANLLKIARTGRFPLEQVNRYQENYVLAGGSGSLKKYFHPLGSEAVFNRELGEQITWAQYDLATDTSFNEFEAIICVGGLAQYASPLRRRALQLFSDSLPMFGVLALPGANSVRPAEAAVRFEILSVQQGIYRKMR